jgi:hypothetical protein
MLTNYIVGGPMFYPLPTWQELNWHKSYGSPDFFDFCNNVTDVEAPASRTKVDQSLAKYTDGEAWTNLGNYAHYFKEVFLPYCKSGDLNSPDCFGTQNSM